MPAMNASMTIDRYRYITTLREAGVEEKIAAAHANGLVNALQDAVATKADIAALETKMDKQFDRIDARFVSVDTRFLSVDARFDAVDARFDAFDEKMDHRFEKFAATITAQIAAQSAADRTFAITLIIPLYALALGALWTTVQILRQPAPPAAVTIPAKP